jgi:hypothetical protein
MVVAHLARTVLQARTGTALARLATIQKGADAEQMAQTGSKALTCTSLSDSKQLEVFR